MTAIINKKEYVLIELLSIDLKDSKVIGQLAIKYRMIYRSSYARETRISLFTFKSFAVFEFWLPSEHAEEFTKEYITT